jgi:signal transduction histidine kinase
MTRRYERAAVLGVVGVGLAAFGQFGPLLWPYGLGPAWSPATQAWAFAVDLMWVVAMVATYLRDPTGRLWKLLLAFRIVASAGVLWVFPTSLTWTLSQLTVGLGGVVFVHLVLAFPTGRLEDRLDRRFVTAAYLWLAVTHLAWLLVWKPPATLVGFSPRNPFVVLPDATLATLFGPIANAVLAAVLLVGVSIGLVRHWGRAGPVERRALLPVLLAAPVQLALMVVWQLAGANPAEWGDLRVVLQSPVVALAGLLFPVAYLLGLLRARLARAGVADLAVELGRGVPLGGLEATLARALGDPSLELAFPAPAGDGLVRADGQPFEQPPPGRGRGAARIERGGGLLAVLVYDQAIEREDPGRIDAVGSVAGLALGNERLAAQVRAQLEEVRASRTRIVEAADAERRRIERDLHDGAQQRLVALALRLDQARGTEISREQLIDDTTAELLAAIAEVRDLARGVHPPILTDAGLVAAVEALVERTPFPVRVDAAEGRYPPEVEAAAYFVVAEGLTNVARHAGASEARVSVQTEPGCLVVSVADDGRGGADATGSGLRGLSDRLEALDGELTVTSAPDAGTTLLARLPTGA